MGKARTNSRGYTREQELLQENRLLKRQVSSLRKQLARLDLDRYDMVKEMIQNHYKEEKVEEGKEILENLKKDWACHKCSDGYLQITIFNRGKDTIYYRLCSNSPACMQRTKAKIYTPEVKGIMRETKDE